MAQIVGVIWGWNEGVYFRGRGWTGQITLIWLRKLGFARRAMRALKSRLNDIVEAPVCEACLSQTDSNDRSQLRNECQLHGNAERQQDHTSWNPGQCNWQRPLRVGTSERLGSWHSQENSMHKDQDKIVETAVEVRGGRLGRPVLLVLLLSCVLAVAALVITYSAS